MYEDNALNIGPGKEIYSCRVFLVYLAVQAQAADVIVPTGKKALLVYAAGEEN